MTEPTPADPELLIFDCDGVLVDSEVLVCAAVSEELTRLGYPITPADVVRRFAGLPKRDILAELAGDWGQPVPPAYYAAMKTRVKHAFENDLQAVAGTHEVLAALTLPRVVASSSAPAKLEQGLRFVGLHHYFTPDILSVHRVAHGKPAPDVFIYAAGWMHTPTAACLVLEDSEPGVRAARAAGMRVWGFTGGSPCPPGHGERVLAAGAALSVHGWCYSLADGAERVLAHMRELPAALPSAFRGTM